jgi:hypothetical protein
MFPLDILADCKLSMTPDSFMVERFRSRNDEERTASLGALSMVTYQASVTRRFDLAMLSSPSPLKSAYGISDMPYDLQLCTLS